MFPKSKLRLVRAFQIKCLDNVLDYCLYSVCFISSGLKCIRGHCGFRCVKSGIVAVGSFKFDTESFDAAEDRDERWAVVFVDCGFCFGIGHQMTCKTLETSFS
jgi:hypothetical protein